MPEIGSTPVAPPSPLTTPVSKLQTDSYHPTRGQEVGAVSKSLPTPDTLEAYRDVVKEPYAFEYFHVDGAAKKLTSFKEWASGIDEYVMNEIRNGQLEDSLETYQHILKEITKSMSLHQDLSESVKMGKIYQWIHDVIEPLRALERKKQIILR